MKKVNIFILVILLLTAGCGGNRQSGNDDFITVDVTKSYPKKELILQDFMDVEYIALETGGEFYCQGLVQAIGKNIIIVKNQVRDGDIFIFDRNGKGLRKINRMGRSGEEYSDINGIILDEENGEIFVRDFTKINVYDLYGLFKRRFRIENEVRYSIKYNFDKENMICDNAPDRASFSYLDAVREVTHQPSFVITSKQDGSIINNVQISYEQKKPAFISLVENNYARNRIISYSSIIPYHDNWILTEPSSDTVFRFLPDFSMIPFIVRTPSIQSMNPEVFLFPSILTDHYYFMQTVKKEFDFATWTGLPQTNLVYDRHEKAMFEYSVYNDDYLDKIPVDMNQATINNEIAFWQKIEADELVEDYEKGVLKGKLKEIAAKLKEEDNPVIMLVKHKK